MKCDHQVELQGNLWKMNQRVEGDILKANLTGFQAIDFQHQFPGYFALFLKMKMMKLLPEYVNPGPELMH